MRWICFLFQSLKYESTYVWGGAHCVEKVENLKIEYTLLLHARHSFTTIIKGEWSAIKRMMIADRCVFMKTINSMHIGIWKTIVHIIWMMCLWNEPCIRSCRDLTDEVEESLVFCWRVTSVGFSKFWMNSLLDLTSSTLATCEDILMKWACHQLIVIIDKLSSHIIHNASY
jgi:hypothetical protein